MGRRRVTLRQEAEIDIDTLYDFIAADSPANARAFSARLRAYCDGLGDFGERGMLRPELGPGLRVIGFERRASVVFRVLDDSVQIVRVFYRGRDLEALMKE